MKKKRIDHLRVGVVGAGGIADLHCIGTELAGLQLVGITDIVRKAADAKAAKYQIPVFDDLSSLLAAGLDFIIIGTRHPQHAAVAIEALRRGISVLVEKPLAATLADCDLMIEAALKSGAKLGCISQRRWMPALARMKSTIEQGKIGIPSLGMATMLGHRSAEYYLIGADPESGKPWRGTWDGEGGATLVNQGPHPLDHLLWLMGAEIDWLVGNWSNVNHPTIETEDSASAIIHFKNGATGVINFTNAAANPGISVRVHIVGKNGGTIGVKTDGPMFVAGQGGMADPPVNDIWNVSGDDRSLERLNFEDSLAFGQYKDPTHVYHTLQIRDFAEAVANGHEPSVTAKDGRRVVEVFTAIYRSQRTGGRIVWPLIPDEMDTDFAGRTSQPIG